jgi:hypothetical protein
VDYEGSLDMVRLCSVEELLDPVVLLDVPLVVGFRAQVIVLGEEVVVVGILCMVRLIRDSC